MEVEISIDKITDCPIDTTTGREVETDYRMCETPIRPKDYKRKKPRVHTEKPARGHPAGFFAVRPGNSRCYPKLLLISWNSSSISRAWEPGAPYFLLYSFPRFLRCLMASSLCRTV